MSFATTFNAFQIDNLTSGQKAVLTTLATFERNGKAWPSVATIAKRASMGIRTVQRHLAALVNLGYIERIYRAGHAAVTRLFIGQTPAKLAPPPLPNWHPESGISESVNEIPAAAVTPSPDTASAAIVVLEKIPEQPEPRQAPVIVEFTPGADTFTPLLDAPAPTASELAATEPVSTPSIDENPLAEVPAVLLADLGEVRKAKKKPAKVTRTEAQILKTEAEKAGWTMEQVIVTMICHGWSRFQADWVQHVPQQATVQGPQSVFVPEVVQPASPSAIARFKAEWARQKAQMQADSARRREEQLALRKQ